MAVYEKGKKKGRLVRNSPRHASLNVKAQQLLGLVETNQKIIAEA